MDPPTHPFDETSFMDGPLPINSMEKNLGKKFGKILGRLVGVKNWEASGCGRLVGAGG